MKTNEKTTIKVISSITIIIILFITVININAYAVNADYNVDLTNLTVNGSAITNYTQDDYEQFVTTFKSSNLPAIYTTEFLYDGAGMVKTPDLDDYTDESGDGNNAKIKTLSIKAINVNTTGNVQFSGEIKGGMIAVNTNGITGDINLILNGVNIDTDSKKAPAIYVYNKNINYTDHKVTIKTTSGSKNYLEGGKLKKVSLVGSDELNNYISKYSGTAKTNYQTYTNYYGIYTAEQINNVLFAKVQADNEDLSDGDPYYFYKGAGAISSDIDLYFEGEGYLSVISKNKEGIETKGNLTFTGGKGDYYIFAEDDCLNTTTSSQSNGTVRNTLTINVNSLTAMVDPEADEGDCIDSNGELIINGGTILAFAHPTSQDDGLDSDKGTYINGGTVVATGNMSDSISDSSKQDFIKLNFGSKQDTRTLICVTDTQNNPIIAFKSDRTFTTLTLSSPNLTKSTYYVYKGGTITGTETNGLYTKTDSYTGGTQQQWGGINSNRGQMPQDNNEGQQKQTPPENNGGTTGEMRPQNMNNSETPPDKPNDNGQNINNNFNEMKNNNSETSNEFILSATQHTFNNVTDYQVTETNEDNNIDSNNTNKNATDNSTAPKTLPNAGTYKIIIMTIIGILAISATVLQIKNKRMVF